MTDARGDFDGLVPLLVEKIARSIRAVDGRRPVAVVTSPNDRDVLGMTLRRLADLPHQRGASDSRHRRREANGSTEYNDASDDDAPTRVFTAMDAALGPHRHGEHTESSHAVDAHAAMTTQLAATGKKAFAYDAKFAGDVDVDEIALRCAKRDWDPGDLEHGAVEHDGARTRGVAGADFSSPGADFSPSPFGAVVVAWDGRDDSIFNRYLSSPVPRESSSARPHASARGDERLTPRGWTCGAMLDVVAVDAPAMLADFGDYGEVPSLAPESVAKLRAADVVVLHHVSLLPSSAAVEAVQRRVVDAVKSAPNRDEKSAPPRVPPGPVLVRTESRCEKTERLHRYAGASPAHEWTPPPSRLRGARVLGMTACRGGDGRRRGFKALLASLVAPADRESDVNGYGLRLRTTGTAEVLACDGEGADSGGGADLGGGAEGAEGTGAFAREFLARVVARFRQTHASSGDVGGAEARVVLSERDAWRLLTGGSRDRIRDGLNFLSAADPLVLRFALQVETNGNGVEDGLTSSLRSHLERCRDS